MHRYVILTNRKRAIVALVHSVAFLLIALYGLISVVRPLGAWSPASAWTMAGVYVAVASALAVLSGNWRERLYFGFCATSATFGLLRQILGARFISTMISSDQTGRYRLGGSAKRNSVSRNGAWTRTQASRTAIRSPVIRCYLSSAPSGRTTLSYVPASNSMRAIRLIASWRSASRRFW